jgi:hypothetical protein
MVVPAGEREVIPVDAKSSANHREVLRALARMTPEERLRQTLELSDFTRRLFKQGLKKRFPKLAPDRLHRLYLERLGGCHNRNY